MGVFAAIGCGGSERQTAARTATNGEATAPKPLGYGQFISTGTYITKTFTPRFTFHVSDDGWFAYEADRFVFVERHNENRVIDFERPAAVLDPRTQENELSLPKDLPRWLAQHPNLTVVERSRGSVGGVTGPALEVAVNSIPKNPPDRCDDPCVALFASGGGFAEPFNLLEGEKARFIFLEIAGEAVVVIVTAHRSDFTAWLPEAETILASVKWTP